MHYLREFLFLQYFVSLRSGPIDIDHPEDLCNLLAGSFTEGQSFSTGNTLPLIGRPWGFNHFAPQTRTNAAGSWWFNGNDHSFYWMRLTHQPSPWIGDYAWFVFAPMIGNPSQNAEQFWEPRGSTIKPHIFDATLAPYGTRFELIPTMHGAIIRIHYPSIDAIKYMCFHEAEWISKESHKITGISRRVSQDRLPVSNFGFHILITSDSSSSSSSSSSIFDQNGVLCFQYPSSTESMIIRISTSLISHEQAEINAKYELLGKTFDEIAQDSRQEWNTLLKRVDVMDAGDMSEESSKHLSVFYTGLYRGLTFPRRTDEITSDGHIVHYSPYDPQGQVHAGPGVTDNGFWDTFRTVYPMLSLLYPDKLGMIVQGWLNAFKEGGWLPSWASPGYRNCMVGTFADVVIADAIVKNVKGFDLVAAYEALKKDSFVSPPFQAAGAVGKHGLEEYLSRGYISMNGGTGGDYVSRTLDFAFADWACANAFEVLSKNALFEMRKEELLEQIKELRARSTRAVSSLFNPSCGLMVPKDTSGLFFGGFRPIEWGNGYTEGNAWQHSFPPFALEQLATLHGGKTKLLDKLKHLVSMQSDFLPGSYHQEIHEMREGRAVALGQYAHNNQPSHHLLYLFALLGDRENTEKYVRIIMDRAYGRDFYAGDEDNGEMGAWFVLSALGLYSVAPGSSEYVFGSPLFKYVRVERFQEDGSIGNPLHILALGTNVNVIHVEKVKMNQIIQTKPTINDMELQNGGILQFIMKGEITAINDEISVTVTPEKLSALLHEVPPGPALVPLSSTITTTTGLNLSEIESLRQQIQQMKAEEIDLNHQIKYLQHKLHPDSAIPDAPIGTRDSDQTDNYYAITCIILLILVCILSALSIQHLKRTTRNGKFKSEIHSV